MHFESFSAFIEMGGHGFYVWLSWGIVVSGLVFTWLKAASANQRSIELLRKFYRQRERQLTGQEQATFGASAPLAQSDLQQENTTQSE